MKEEFEGMRKGHLSEEERARRKAERAEKRRLREEKKKMIRHGGWEDVIRAVAREKDPDIALYRKRLENASITLDMLRDMALNRGMRLHVMRSGTIELSFRKGDHTAVTTITADGRVNTMMKDFLDY